ncbi:MAG: B12-binding domain-containing radical SAM protein [Candidatus Scalindua sp.]|jgi:anaerobic magnesium-protoporphyrin IX monomethyl ester cyclase|nr:B12-binding domain-containing radical SAM protein [Candidatus Scalindua sp.]
MKGKVLFIIHDNYQEDNVFPIGPGYLAAVLRQAGADVSVYCMDIFHYTNEELAQYLSEHEFDLIGIGFMAPRFNRTVVGVCKVVNENKKNAWLVLGGNGPTPIAEYCIEQTNADVTVLGEGEETIVELLECKLNSPESISEVQGIVYWVGKQVVQNQRRKPPKLDTLPLPAWDLFPMDKYTTCLKVPRMKEADIVFPMITTRGCISKCSFCYRMESGIRIRKPEHIIEEMKDLHKKYGVTYFIFFDELSVISKKQILKFSSMIKENFEDIRFYMNCRVDVFDDEIACAMKEAGCALINIGFESTDQNVLDLLGKRVTVEQNINAAELALKYDMAIGLNVIWGLPGDNERTLRENTEFIKRYNRYDQIRTMRPVSPYPGSPLYYLAIQKGLLKGPADFFAKFKNADLYMVNFMGIPEKDIYEMLFDVNKDLILDHYRHTSNDMEEADRLIQQFYNLYFKGNVSLAGPRHDDKLPFNSKRDKKMQGTLHG